MKDFLKGLRFPLVIVGALSSKERKSVIPFLRGLGAPFYAESVSGIREESSLSHLRIGDISYPDYPVDGVLRIGGVPTHRFWRDLEYLRNRIKVFSLSSLPFAGLSFGQFLQVDIDKYLNGLEHRSFFFANFSKLFAEDRERREKRLHLFRQCPKAEPSIFYFLSRTIPAGSLIYLGNSMPIRHWDLAASYEQKNFFVLASRGLNGIDGQISTFLGLARPGRENWAILGDMTVLHDLNAFWILRSLKDLILRIVIINNRGGMIFREKFKEQLFQNRHSLSFESLAKFWHIDYKLFHAAPACDEIAGRHVLIEIIPEGDLSCLN